LKTRNSLLAFAALFALLLAPSYQAAADSWWYNEDEGWFFYKDTYYPEEEKPRAPAPAPPAETAELYTDRMQRIGKELMSTAIEDPTEENVGAYMEHNKAQLIMADNFSVAWQKVLMKYPHLLFEGGLKHSYEDVNNAVASLGNEAGLYFIHSSTCPACRKQAAALRDFEQAHNYRMKVFPITLDAPLPEYPDAVTDNGIARNLNVTQIPSIFIAFPSRGKVERISEGYIDKHDLERRLLNYAKPIDTKSVEVHLDNAGSHSHNAQPER
jgi:hypothetical protein